MAANSPLQSYFINAEFAAVASDLFGERMPDQQSGGLRPLDECVSYGAWKNQPCNGSQIAFAGSECVSPSINLRLGIHVMDADGSNQREVAHTHRRQRMAKGPPVLIYLGGLAWSPDGESLSYSVWQELDGERHIALYALAADGSGLTRLYAEPVGKPFASN